MAVIDYKLMGLIPSDALWWHRYDAATSTNGYIADLSGNGRHLTSIDPPPLLTVATGQWGWYFDGTKSPFTVTTSITPKHVFVFASATGAAFNLNRGLLSGLTTGDWLASNTSGTSFLSPGAAWDYLKSDTPYADAAMTAPMNEIPELIEITNATGVVMDGIQVGQQRNLDANARKWKGYFYESIGFNRILTETERLRVMLHFNIVSSAWVSGVPLWFPDKTLLTGTRVIAPTRFDDDEPEYSEITDKWQYEDGGEDFNEIGSVAPQGWDYEMQIAEGTAAQAYAYREIFDGFNRQARLVNPFFFRDKWGEVWSNVRIESYKSSHSAHKSWEHNISFRLRANSDTIGGVGSFEGYLTDGGVYIIEG